MMPRQDELHAACLLASQRGYEIIAPHVRMNDVYAVLEDKLCDCMYGLKIK